MSNRLNIKKAPKKVFETMMSFEAGIRSFGLDAKLTHRIRIRASQINGCAFCLKMHFKEALADNESQDRLNLVSVWRECGEMFDQRERAALAWTEALTRLAETHAPDEDYALLQAAFSDEEQYAVTLVINSINAWNRLNVGFRTAP